MRKILTIIACLGIVDLLTPPIHTGAQVAIAPLLIAAIVSAVGGLASSQQAKQGALAQASAQGAQGGGGGIEMESALSKQIEQEAKEASGAGGKNMAFKTGAMQDPYTAQVLSAFGGGDGASASKISDAQKLADNDGVASDAPINTAGIADPVKPTDDPDVVQVPNPADAGKDAEGKDGEGIDTGEGGLFKDMSTGDKMAMAASIASLLRGPGPPPPPSAGGGPGINMQPVSLRSMYGRR